MIANALTAAGDLSQEEAHQIFAAVYDACVASGQCNNCLKGN